MIEINLVNPKIEPTAMKDTFILPLWKHNKRFPFMMLTFTRTYGSYMYSLKKVVKYLVSN